MLNTVRGGANHPLEPRHIAASNWPRKREGRLFVTFAPNRRINLLWATPQTARSRDTITHLNLGRLQNDAALFLLNMY